ncbi:hypothetical protein BH09ACT10_BH09ACT10_29160 [soil metagenome]
MQVRGSASTYDERMRSSLVRFLALLAVAGTALAVSNAPAESAVTGMPIAKTNCTAFPADNWWHADISKLPVHARNARWLSHMSTGVNLHPDFGPSYGDGPNYGIPITVVKHSHKRVKVTFDYAAESDRKRYPFGKDTRIEGGRNSGGDMHAIVVDKKTCRLFETWNTRVSPTKWRAGSGAIWSLKSNALRPDGWTSADAAGLPILPGLLRWNEVKAGKIDHAIRFTTNVTSAHHVWPARHDAGSTNSRSYPPMGARFRLKSSFSTAGMSAYAKNVVAAMKKYGLVLADNGSPWYFQGEQNKRWPDRLIEDLKTIPASAFVAVDASSLKVSNDSAAVR